MEIEISGGKGEIGGNKILIEHKGTKILLDFGMSFKQAGKYFSEFLQPRKCAGLTDFFELGLLPKLKGAYRQDYLNHMGEPQENREIDALFLSHAHADHAQFIHFLRPDIPIYSTKASKIILDCLQKTGSNPFSDLVSACEAFTFYTNTTGAQSKVTKKSKDPVSKKSFVHERKFNIMKPYEKVKIGSLEVEMVPVDHSLPGACGFIIYSDEGNLVYTGDIRFHGSNKHLSEKFVELASAAKPKWLLSEGTRIKDSEGETEIGVKNKISELISKTPGLVFIEHPIRDLDRVNSIFQAAKENGRFFVVNLKLAYLIQKLGDLCPFTLDDIKIVISKKKWGLIEKPGFDLELIEQEYVGWERPFISLKNAIPCKDIKKNPSNYVVSMSMWEIQQLIDLKPKDAIWIKSSCEPFCDEMVLDEERKKNWLKHFGIKSCQAHASGHASGDEIRQMISDINPENLIAIHTEHPEECFRKKCICTCE